MSAVANTTLPQDHAAREHAITAVGENMLVEAGAGTGKTSVLVARIIEVLRTGHAAIDEIAVITFTEKAAAELAARVRLELEQAARNAADEGNDDDYARLREALLGLHRARIETIHAFTANLLRERPVEARLDPNFDVLDDLDAELAFMRAYEKWLDELLGPTGADDKTLQSVLNRGIDVKQIEDIARSVHAHRDALDDSGVATTYPRVPPPDLDAFANQLGDACGVLASAMSDCTNHADEGYRQIDPILRFGEEVEIARERRQYARIERLITSRAPFIKQKGNQGNFSDAQSCRNMKTTFKELSALIGEAAGSLRAQAMADFVPMVARFVRRYEQQRRTDGKAEFTDLLVWARELVAGNEEVRRYFQRRFACVLVDEFQDTDPIQAELIVRICSEEGSSAAQWTELPLRPGSLFVVGDPKQSIYRFRRADMTVYDEIKQNLFGGNVVPLAQNFRSNGGVLGWVNRVFDRVFGREDPGVQPANIALLVHPEVEQPNGRGSVVVLHGEQAVRSQQALRVAEGEQLAALVKRAVREECWQIRDRRGGELRAAKWSDVAIVIPVRTDVELYERAFQNAGVPYRHEGNRTFFQRQEVRDLANCLYAIDDPSDDIALVGALRSAAFGVSDEELFLFRSDGGALDYRRVDHAPEGHEQVVAAMLVLRDLHRERRRVSLPELVYELLQRTNLVEYALTDRVGGVQSAGNLLKVVDQAREFAGAGGGGLRSFARWLATSSDPENEEAEASVIEEEDDVVRILTIHKAKGLEFPIVALANSNADRRSQKRTFVDRSSGRLQVYGVGKWVTPGFDDAWATEQRHEEAERDRTLYVAATRARDYFIAPVFENSASSRKVKGHIDTLLQDLPGWEDDVAGRDVDGCHVYDRALLEVGGGGAGRDEAAVADGAVDEALHERGVWLAERDAVVEGADEGLTWVTASSQEKWEGRPAAAEGDEPGAGLRVSRSEARAIGTALHKVMEVVDLETRDELEAIATAMCREAGVPDALEEVMAMARNCLDSEVVQRAVAAGPANYWREVPFTVPREDGSGFDVGQIDLVFREADGSLTVVDYKTDLVEGGDVDAIAARYAGQIEMYRAGALAAMGREIGDVVLVWGRGSGRHTSL